MSARKTEPFPSRCFHDSDCIALQAPGGLASEPDFKPLQRILGIPPRTAGIIEHRDHLPRVGTSGQFSLRGNLVPILIHECKVNDRAGGTCLAILSAERDPRQGCPDVSHQPARQLRPLAPGLRSAQRVGSPGPLTGVSSCRKLCYRAEEEALRRAMIWRQA